MALKLDADPTFQAEVGIPVPGKGDVAVFFTFKHRDQPAFEKFMQDARTKKMENVKFIMDVVVGWNLDDPFNKENVAKLLRNYHGAAGAIGRAYGRELSGARLGN